MVRDKIIIGLFLYAVAWLVFASFDFNGSDTIVAYQLRPTGPSAKDLPKMISVGTTTYHISGQIVVGQAHGFGPTRYTDCAVVDEENWTCTYDDKSGKFGFQDGDYFSVALRGAVFPEKGWQSVSRFRYVWNYVEWDLASRSWLQKATALIRPFFM